jgi:transposase
MPKKKSARVRRTFTPQFKKDAVAMVRKGKTVTEVAASLGIARSLLQYWQRQLDGEGDQAFPGKGNASSETEELRELKKKLKDVTEERDILKKALAYFADDQK